MLEEFLYTSTYDCVEKSKYFRPTGLWTKNSKTSNALTYILNRVQYSADYFAENHMMVHEVYIHEPK